MKSLKQEFFADGCPVVNSRGMTFVELIIAMVIGLVVVAGAFVVFLNQTGAFRATRSVSVEQARLNIAFNTVKYNLRVAGFDGGTSYYYDGKSSGIYPVSFVNANGDGSPDGTYPYEVLVSYTPPNSSNDACQLIAQNYDQTSGKTSKSNNGTGGGNCDSEFVASPSSCWSSFYAGEVIISTGDIPCPKYSGTPPAINCVDKVSQHGQHYITLRAGQSECAGDVKNPTPQEDIAVINGALVMQQKMFYWGSSAYTAPSVVVVDSKGNPTYNSSPFNVPGTLYECEVYLPVAGNPPSSAPACLSGTTLALDDYVNYFSVSTLPSAYKTYSGDNFYYIYNLSISAESDAAITTSSSAFSVNTSYQGSNSSGASPLQGGRVISGYNIVKTLNASIYARNVMYGN